MAIVIAQTLPGTGVPCRLGVYRSRAGCRAQLFFRSWQKVDPIRVVNLFTYDFHLFIYLEIQQIEKMEWTRLFCGFQYGFG
jgi:hypothetical protein